MQRSRMHQNTLEGESEGEVGGASGPDRRPAVDGKRSCDGRSVGGSGSDISKEGGSWGEGGLQILLGSTPADDGKRFQAMDVVCELR